MLDHSTYKKTYGSMLLLQSILGLTYFIAAKSCYSYALWVWLTFWCEGSHYILVPNICKIVYGPLATELYGFMYTFNSFACAFILIVTRTRIGQDYINLWVMAGFLSAVAMPLLLRYFTQEAFSQRLAR